MNTNHSFERPKQSIQIHTHQSPLTTTSSISIPNQTTLLSYAISDSSPPFMAPYCLSSTRNAVTPFSLNLPRYRVPQTAASDNLHLRLRTHSLHLSVLRIRSNRLSPSPATLSSFAESGDGKEDAGAEPDDGESRGMAQAFKISSATASAISICIAVAVLCLPLAMKSLGQGLAVKTRLLSYATLLFGFYMAWNIGANDVANAMGTSVGSGALTLRQAVLTAAVLEFSGALLMGTHVTSTMQKGILMANVFQGKDTLLFAGLLSSLAAAGTWLQVKY